MAKSSSLLFVTLALAAGGLVLMATAKGGELGLRVEGDCDEIVVTNELTVAHRIAAWVNANPTPAPTHEEQIARIWTHLAGCVPKSSTILRGVDRIPVVWADYVNMAIYAIGDIPPGLEGGAPQDLAKDLLDPLRVQVATAVFPSTGGGGSDGPFTPPGGRG